MTSTDLERVRLHAEQYARVFGHNARHAAAIAELEAEGAGPRALAFARAVTVEVVRLLDDGRHDDVTGPPDH